MTTQSDIKKLQDQIAALQAAIESVRFDLGTAVADLQSSVQPLLDAKASPVERLTPEMGPLYEELRVWRAEVAKVQGVPAYRVLTNGHLADIATRLPADRYELSQIKGVGPDRLDKYGAALIAIVGKYRDQLDGEQW